MKHFMQDPILQLTFAPMFTTAHSVNVRFGNLESENDGLHLQACAFPANDNRFKIHSRKKISLLIAATFFLCYFCAFGIKEKKSCATNDKG
jgi:hypothetical protein